MTDYNKWIEEIENGETKLVSEFIPVDLTATSRDSEVEAVVRAAVIAGKNSGRTFGD